MVLLKTKVLPYTKHALEPIMSSKTLEYHFEHLAKNYAKNYNAHKGDPKFNLAGNFLHSFENLETPTNLLETFSNSSTNTLKVLKSSKNV